MTQIQLMQFIITCICCSASIGGLIFSYIGWRKTKQTGKEIKAMKGGIQTWQKTQK